MQDDKTWKRIIGFQHRALKEETAKHWIVTCGYEGEEVHTMQIKKRTICLRCKDGMKKERNDYCLTQGWICEQPKIQTADVKLPAATNAYEVLKCLYGQKLDWLDSAGAYRVYLE